MSKRWKIAIIKDTSRPMLGLHGLHVAFRGLPNVEVAAHVDSNSENLEEKLRYTQAKRHYTCYYDMLERESPDIVTICSRHPDDHQPQIRAAAERGCHIYCEKPLAATLEEADAIIEIAERYRIRIAMAHIARHALKFRAMKELIEAGEIGEPLMIHGRGKCDHRGGGEDLVVLGTHILDLMTFYFGPPDFVSAEVTANGHPIGQTDRAQTVEPIGRVAGDRIFAYLGFSGGVRGVFESRKGLFAYGDELPQIGISVQGTKGTLSLRFDDARERPLLLSRQAGPPESGLRYEEISPAESRIIPGAAALDYSLCGQTDIPHAPMFLEGNRYGVWDLMRAIERDGQPLANAYGARTVLEIIHAIYTSHLSSGARVGLPPTRRVHPLVSDPI